MKKVMLAVLSLVGVGILFFAGLTLSTVAGVVGRGGSYDMPTEQTRQFVASTALKRGWSVKPDLLSRSANPKPGEVQTDYSAPLLPWSSARIFGDDLAGACGDRRDGLRSRVQGQRACRRARFTAPCALQAVAHRHKPAQTRRTPLEVSSIRFSPLRFLLASAPHPKLAGEPTPAIRRVARRWFFGAPGFQGFFAASGRRGYDRFSNRISSRSRSAPRPVLRRRRSGVASLLRGR